MLMLFAIFMMKVTLFQTSELKFHLKTTLVLHSVSYLQVNILEGILESQILLSKTPALFSNTSYVTPYGLLCLSDHCFQFFWHFIVSQSNVKSIHCCGLLRLRRRTFMLSKFPFFSICVSYFLELELCLYNENNLLLEHVFNSVYVMHFEFSVTSIQSKFCHIQFLSPCSV